MVPWHFQRICVQPGRKIYGLLIEHDPSYKIGKELMNILYDYSTFLISYISTYEEDREEDLAIIDMTNLTIDLKELKEEIGRIKGVRRVEELEPVEEGLFVDYMHHPLTLLGGRALLLREPALSKIVNDGYRRFGEPFSIWLYYTGKDAGRAFYESHVSILRKFDEEKVLKLSRYMFQIVGFGLLEHVKVGEEEALVRVRDSLEVEVNSGSGRSCQFVRGMLEGWFSGFFGRDAECVETKCENRGDEYCEFEIRVRS